MNELRWILLIAGALLIAGIYAWGLRSRQRGVVDREVHRPAVFTGSARGFEAGDDDGTVDDEDGRAGPGEMRRLEPSVMLDDDVESTPAIERRGDFAVAVEAVEPLIPPVSSSRREPTFGDWPEPVAVPVGEPAALEPAELPPASRRPVPAPDHDASPAPAPAVHGAAGAARPQRTPQKIFALRVVAGGGGHFAGGRVLEAMHAEGLRFGRYDVFHCLHGDGRPVFSVASLKEPGTFDVAAMPATQYPGVLIFAVLPGPVTAAEAFDEMVFTARALATQLGGALADDKGAPLTAQRAGRLREEAIEFERAVAAGAA